MIDPRLVKTGRVLASGQAVARPCLLYSLCGIGITTATCRYMIYNGFGSDTTQIMEVVCGTYSQDFRHFDIPLFFSKGIYVKFDPGGDDLFIQYSEIEKGKGEDVTLNTLELLEDKKWKVTPRINASKLVHVGECLIKSIAGTCISPNKKFEVINGFNAGGESIMYFALTRIIQQFRSFCPPLYFSKGLYISLLPSGADVTVHYLPL